MGRGFGTGAAGVVDNHSQISSVQRWQIIFVIPTEASVYGNVGQSTMSLVWADIFHQLCNNLQGIYSREFSAEDKLHSHHFLMEFYSYDKVKTED